jgi:hypothetical protein
MGFLTHLGQACRIGIIHHGDGPTERSIQMVGDVVADPAVVDVGGRPRDALDDDSLNVQTDRCDRHPSRQFKVGDRLEYAHEDPAGSRLVRQRDDDSVARDPAGAGADRAALIEAANIDANRHVHPTVVSA